METSLKRARANDGVAGAPSATLDGNATAIAELHAAALNKIADLQLRLDACEKSRSYMHGKHRLEVDTLKSNNEGLKSALKWACSIGNIPRQHWLDEGHDEEYAVEMERLLPSFKQIIQSLRMGTVSGPILIHFNHHDEDGNRDAVDHGDFLMPYWKEFAAALTHWSEYHADEISLKVFVCFIEIPKAVLDVLRPAFEQSRIESFFFRGSRHPGDMADFVTSVLQTNLYITTVGFAGIAFAHEDLKAIYHRAIKSRNAAGQITKILQLQQLSGCFQDGIETETLEMILASVSTAAASKEVTLYLDKNGMSSREAVVIAEFLSSNPTLTALNLSDNRFDNADAAVLANSLSSNTNLRELYLENDEIKKNGRFAFLHAMFDVSSLASCAASNHTCRVWILQEDPSALINNRELISMNKWEKIFAMLALSCGDSFINTSLLEGVPAHLIPMLLNKADFGANEEDDPRVTDLYLELTNIIRSKKHDVWDNLGKTKPINCMYELMRCWVVPLIFA